jgi:cytoskeletal protein RodZ
METQEKKHKLLKLLLIILLGIVLIGATGFGVWYWQQDELKKQKTDSDKKISELQKQIKEVKGQSTTTNSATNEKELPSNTFNIDAKPGEKYGSFTLKTIQAFSANNPGAAQLPFSESNLSANFTGEATIDVEYTYTGPDEPAMFTDSIFFNVSNPDSQKKIPALKGTTPTRFMVSNVAIAKNAFGIENISKTGTAKIVIKDYSVNRFPSEVGDGATFVRIVN